MDPRVAALRLVASGIVAYADALENETPATAGPYDREHLPPGAASWRAVLDAGTRGELDVTRIGRRSIVTAEAWSAFIASKKTRRAGPVAIEDGDARALEALGCVVPMRRTGTR